MSYNRDIKTKECQSQMKVFYARCSTIEQNEARQIKQAEEIKAEKVFIDKASGKNIERKQLKEMLSFVREGDTVICSDISRIARSTTDLLNIVEQLNNKNVGFVSIKENIDTTTPQGKFMLTVFGAMAELERARILQAQAEGIEEARKRGVYKGRKPIEIDTNKFKKVYDKWKNGDITAVKASEELGFTTRTFYRKVKQYES